jgi:hypothetical protein
MTPWGEKPGGFGGGGFQDNAWLGNAKRQSLFRANPGAISWAGKPNTPGMEAPLPATANVSDQQSGRPAQAPVSMFAQSNDPFGMSAPALQAQESEFNRQADDARRAMERMRSGQWQSLFSSRY